MAFIGNPMGYQNLLFPTNQRSVMTLAPGIFRASAWRVLEAV
jgi:hypothetical protein